MIETIQAFLEEHLSDPKLRALAILLAAIVAARVADWIVTGVFKVATAQTKTMIDDKVIDRLHKPIFRTVFLVGAYYAAISLDPGERAVFWLFGIVGSLLVLIWTSAIYNVVHVLLTGLTRQPKVNWVNEHSEPLYQNLMLVLVWGLALYVVLTVWDLDVKPWLASAGVAGLAIGFAAKDTLANLFGGLFILIDRPYVIGDYVMLDNSERGCVTKIGLRSTRLLTRDDVEVTIPNAICANAKIVNESSGPDPKSRVTLKVGVAYGSDVDKVKRVLLESAAAAEFLASEPEPRVRFTAFGASSLDFSLHCWTNQPAQRGAALDSMHTEVNRRFLEAAISIPFPQRDVHMNPGGESR